MNVPFVDLKTQYLNIKAEILNEINEVLDNTAYISGRKVKQFEEDFANLHNVSKCIAVSSGTDALHVALKALDIKNGDEVIVPVNTFIATSEAISLCGAKPVFVDNDRNTYNIDYSLIEKSITQNTKAIIAVHLYGQAADMDELLNLSKKYNLYLIEDCSQAHLSEYKQHFVGGLGNIGTFSFYPGKNLGAYGEGGAVVCNDEKLYEKILRFRQHGSVKKYIHDSEGHNYRMEEIQAGVLNIKMKYIKVWTEYRRRIAKLYNEILKNLNNECVITPFVPAYANPVYHLYVIRAKNRDLLAEFLKSRGIETGLHYPIPLHLQNAYVYLNYKQGDFPVAEKYSHEILSLPMYPELTDGMVEYVCENIISFYK